ncbi:MAG: class I SAM-dependent methyltransferase [Bacteroidia bacterium]
MSNKVFEQFGNLDIYVFDQLLKGNINPNSKVLDAGCGNGRNHEYFIKQGYDVSAFDLNSEALEMAKAQAAHLNYRYMNQFKLGDMTQIPFDNDSFDFIINVAVLHFAHNRAHFEKMLSELVRVCKPNGKILIRVATNIGIEHLFKPLNKNDQRYIMPDGNERFVMHKQDFEYFANKVGVLAYEPLKSTNVANLRCMSTWCIQKLD